MVYSNSLSSSTSPHLIECCYLIWFRAISLCGYVTCLFRCIHSSSVWNNWLLFFSGLIALITSIRFADDIHWLYPQRKRHALNLKCGHLQSVCSLLAYVDYWPHVLPLVPFCHVTQPLEDCSAYRVTKRWLHIRKLTGYFELRPQVRTANASLPNDKQGFQPRQKWMLFINGQQTSKSE